MRYLIENRGQGVVKIQVYCPESLAPAFMAFINSNMQRKTPVVKKYSSAIDENFLSEFKTKAVALFNEFLSSGMTANASVSETNKMLKIQGFANASYDNVKQVLTKAGCFRPKNPNKSRL